MRSPVVVAMPAEMEDNPVEITSILRNIRAATEANKDGPLDILARALHALSVPADDLLHNAAALCEPCDHSVNICWCAYRRALEDTAEALRCAGCLDHDHFPALWEGQ